MRVSELCGRRWRDFVERDDSAQVTVFGKGGHTRHILLSVGTWEVLCGIRGDPDEGQPLFLSRTGGGLSVRQVQVIVRQAARRADVDKNVSPHWMRHAHASHALDRGAAVHLVHATLGHSSVATTGRYLRARPTERLEQVPRRLTFNVTSQPFVHRTGGSLAGDEEHQCRSDVLSRLGIARRRGERSKRVRSGLEPRRISL